MVVRAGSSIRVSKRILGCSSRTCNEDSLQGRMVATMLEHRKLFVQGWIKLRRGKQRKHWFVKLSTILFSSLGLDS